MRKSFSRGIGGEWLKLAADGAGGPAGGGQGKWLSLAPFPEPAEEVWGAAAGGKLYVFQGLKPVWQPVGMVYEYDPATDAWTKRKPMPRPSHHTALVELNGKVYFFGGFVLPESGPPSWVPIDNTWEYDPATDAWRALAPMPTKRGIPAATAVGGKIYVIGGAAQSPGDPSPGIHPAQPHRSLGTVEEYDPATNTWRERSPMPTPRNHVAIGAVRGKIYVIGGRLGAAFVMALPGTTDLVQEYDPSRDAWALKAPMPTARSAMGFAVLNDKIYAAGGEVRTYEYLAAFRVFEAYDPATNSWERLPPLPVPRHGMAAAALGNRIHFVSGDVQSAIVPRPKGVVFHTDVHDAFEVPSR
jgi:N-acetylneuraminic acid mutarotase